MKKKYSKPENLLRQANLFFRLVMETYEKTIEKDLGDGLAFYNKTLYAIPIIVNASFACELYFKMLIVLNSNS